MEPKLITLIYDPAEPVLPRPVADNFRWVVMRTQLFATCSYVRIRLLILGAHHGVMYPELLVEDEVVDVFSRPAFDITRLLG